MTASDSCRRITVYKSNNGEKKNSFHSNTGCYKTHMKNRSRKLLQNSHSPPHLHLLQYFLAYPWFLKCHRHLCSQLHHSVCTITTPRHWDCFSPNTWSFVINSSDSSGCLALCTKKIRKCISLQQARQLIFPILQFTVGSLRVIYSECNWKGSGESYTITLKKGKSKQFKKLALTRDSRKNIISR